MEKILLKKGDVVQLSPETVKNKAFSGCMLVVDEPKDFGCQGYVHSLGEYGEPGGLAFYRPTWEEMEYIGRAVWDIE